MGQRIKLFLIGFAMGASDIVPGVSGGTIAFIFGIYEELIYSIKKMSGEVLGLVIRGKIKKSIEETPFSFLVPVGVGVILAIATLANLLSHLLDTSPVFVWSFFLGLVVASILIVRKRVVTWDVHDFVLLILASVFSYFVVGLVPVQTPATNLAFFASGAIAIVAMILPGVSGSFILVLLGKYEQVLEAVVNLDITTLSFIIFGAVLGLSVFARILSWLFEKHHDISVVVLIGLMIGSLRKIWPWKKIVSTTTDRHGAVVPLEEVNTFPDLGNSGFIFALVLFVAAFLTMFYLDRLHVTDENVEMIGDPEYERIHKKAIESQKHK